MLEYSIVNNEYLLTGNILLLITYQLKSFIMFRLVLMSAITFIVFYNLSFETLYIDVFVTNLMMILINAYNLVKAFMKIIPPFLDKEANFVFQKFFSSSLSKNQFLKLLSISKRRVFRVNSPISLAGNGFSSIFFIVSIPLDEGQVKLRLKDTYISTLEEHSWIGIVEYVELINSGNIDSIRKECGNVKWGVDSLVIFNSNLKNKTRSYAKDSLIDISCINEDRIDKYIYKGNDNNDNNKSNINEILDDIEMIDNDNFSNLTDDDEIGFDEEEIKKRKEVILYEWTINDLFDLFLDKDEGLNIKNSLHSLWLVYLSGYLKKKLNDIGRNQNI